MDIKLLAKETSLDNEPAEVVIHDRDGNAYTDEKGEPSVFLVLGEYSDKIREYDRRATNKVLKRRGQSDIDADSLEESGVERLATAVVGWRNITSGGQSAQYSHQGVKDILTAAAWTRNDVMKGMQAHSSFFVKPSAA